ncbi:hypothetical protein [Delftia sp. CH05]|uniref:hypothetical protein n=1 Tax=Delftia sp. CH05 TaxID=2692194 RepID=UPI00135E2E56|nr:hypothetical protein [Delftia sp. CH05]MXN31457.1 hypothetical protein [Delftia sp. CH05]
MNQSEVACDGVRVTRDITPNESAHVVCHVADPIIGILNDYSERNSQALAVYGGLYAMGCALASIGADLGPAADLRKQLSALIDGYDAMQQSKAH